MIPSLIDSAAARPPVTETQRAAQGDFSHELSGKGGEGRLNEESVTPNRSDANERQSSASEVGSLENGEFARVQRNSVELAALATEALQAHATGTSQEFDAQLLSESRIFGLHLGASPYLSIRAYGAGYDELPTAPARPYTLDTTSKGEAMIVYPENGKQGGPVELATADGPGAPVLPESEHLDVNDDSTPRLPSLRMEPAWLEPNHWAQRSVRLARDREGRLLVWMRDFQISTADAARLATHLAKLLADQGMKIHGVMWNGQEVWSSKENSNGIMS